MEQIGVELKEPLLKHRGELKVAFNMISPSDWKAAMLVLTVLFKARKRNVCSGGASERALMEKINQFKQSSVDLFPIEKVKRALIWLQDQHFIELSNDMFLITPRGVDYILEFALEIMPPDSPDEPPSSSGQNPPSPKRPPPPHPPWLPKDPPGGWPPRREPDDPSRVPRKGLPTLGAGEIALPLPDDLQLPTE